MNLSPSNLGSNFSLFADVQLLDLRFFPDEENPWLINSLKVILAQNILGFDVCRN